MPKKITYSKRRLLSLCGRCEKTSITPHCESCKEYYRQYIPNDRSGDRRYYKDRLKTQIFNHYGEVCSCCGESEKVFLTIDHVNNDGKLDRKLNKETFYLKIIQEKFPSKYRILCYNCNCGRERNKGICPHRNIVSK